MSRLRSHLRALRQIRWSVFLLVTFYAMHGVVYADFTQQQLYQLGIDTFDVSGCGDTGTNTTTSAASGTQTTAQQIAGSFIIGFDVNTPKSVITDLATKYHIGGMYLIGTNVPSGGKGAQSYGFTKDFYGSLEKASGSNMIISSDDEGVVTRYDYGSTSFPTAGAMAKKSDAEVTAIGKAAGKVMADNGVNVDLAPVLDLRDVGNGLKGRSFSSDPSVVADKAGAFAGGLESSNITPIFKHFPGFDNTTSGSTDDQKVVMTGDINKTTAPYKTLLAKYPDAGIMLSNMYVTKIDGANPSSMSAATVNYIRSKLGFKGLITTDDLSVSSVTNKAGSLANAVDASITAGVDMPLFTLSAGSTAAAESNLDKIISVVQNDSGAVSAIQKNQATINKYKGSSQPPTPSGSSGGCCGTSATALTGDDNETKIWNYFKGKGLSDGQVAGIMGNIQQESGFDPENIQDPAGRTKDPSSLTGGSQGWGIIQWTPGNKILDEAKQLNITSPIYELGTQLDILWASMQGKIDITKHFDLAHFKTLNANDAAHYFGSQIEGFGDAGNRFGFVDPILKKYGGSGTTASATDSGSSGGCVQGPVDCSGAQGNAKILCAAKAYDTASYSYAAGPRDAKAWHAQCPTIGPSCKIDCSLLVTLAVYDAFGIQLKGTDTPGERADINTFWKKISFSEVQAGDIIQPEPGHVEVVDHVQGKTLYNFAAQTDGIPQPQQVGPQKETDNPGNLYLRYIGPGAS